MNPKCRTWWILHMLALMSTTSACSMPWGGCPLLWALPPAQPLKMGCPRAEVSLPALTISDFRFCLYFDSFPVWPLISAQIQFLTPYSPTQWIWVSVSSWSRWWTGRPGLLQPMGSQRVGHNWATELNWALLPGHICVEVRRASLVYHVRPQTSSPLLFPPSVATFS